MSPPEWAGGVGNGRPRVDPDADGRDAMRRLESRSYEQNRRLDIIEHALDRLYGKSWQSQIQPETAARSAAVATSSPPPTTDAVAPEHPAVKAWRGMRCQYRGWSEHHYRELGDALATALTETLAGIAPYRQQWVEASESRETYWGGMYATEKARAEAAEARASDLEGQLREAGKCIAILRNCRASTTRLSHIACPTCAAAVDDWDARCANPERPQP